MRPHDGSISAVYLVFRKREWDWSPSPLSSHVASVTYYLFPDDGVHDYNGCHIRCAPAEGRLPQAGRPVRGIPPSRTSPSALRGHADVPLEKWGQTLILESRPSAMGLIASND